MDEHLLKELKEIRNALRQIDVTLYIVGLMIFTALMINGCMK